MDRKKLELNEIKQRLSDLDGWQVNENKLMRRFAFANFADSLRFVNRVGEIAEAADHHPDIRFGWGYAEFEITTHDRGGVTEHDFSLARAIDQAARSL